MKVLLLTAAILLCNVAAIAHDFEVDGIYYNIMSKDDLTVAVMYQGDSYEEYDSEYSGSITIPAEVTYDDQTYYVTRILNYAFAGCSNLNSVNIPEGVTRIDFGAFSGCSGLASVTIPGSVESIYPQAFANCNSLTSITIPVGVKVIGQLAFQNCSSLTSINIPESVTSIDLKAFEKCSSLISIQFSANVTSISSRTFAGCSSLTSITIPESVTEIGNGAFAGCINLTSITIPKDVTSIETGAFSGCSKFSYITCKASTPPTVSRSSTFNLVDKTIPVYVPGSSVDAYQSAEYWNEFTNIQPLPSRKELLDSEENFTQAEDESFAEITYTRNYTGNWEALYIPFEITVDEAFLSSFEVAYINDVRSYDNDNNGEVDDMVMEAFKITSGTLRASYPYLIRAKNAGEATITVTDATLYATTAENMHSVNCSSVYMEYTVSGTYTTMTADQLDGCYAMSKGGAWIEASSPSATLRPFRLYLSMESRDDSYLKVNPTALKAIRLKVDGEETTSIDNEQLTIDNSASAVVYDLQGRRVENPGKGVYIVNGKKVIYK